MRSFKNKIFLIGVFLSIAFGAYVMNRKVLAQPAANLSSEQITAIRQAVRASNESVLRDMDYNGYEITFNPPDNELVFIPHNSDLPIVYRPLSDFITAASPSVHTQTEQTPVGSMGSAEIQRRVNALQPLVGNECPICTERIATEETVCCHARMCTKCKESIEPKYDSILHERVKVCPFCRHAPLQTVPV